MKKSCFHRIASFLLFSILITDAVAQSNSYDKVPPPLFTDNWTELENEKSNEAGNLLAIALTEKGFPVPDIKKSRVRKLVCYENVLLYEYEGLLNGTTRLYTLIAGQDYYRLVNGESSAIFYINSRQRPILHTETGLKEYIRLFVGCLADEGKLRFRVFNDPAELTDYLTPAAEIFSIDIVPQVITGVSKPGNPGKASVTLKYRQPLFRAELAIDDSGKVDMISDRHLFTVPTYIEKFDKGGFLLQYRPASVPDSVSTYSVNAQEYYNKGMKIASGAKSPGEYFTAYTMIEDAAAMGYMKAFSKLGVFFLRGDGVKKDTSIAVAYYQKGIEKGDSASWYSLERLKHSVKSKKLQEDLDRFKKKDEERKQLIRNVEQDALAREKKEQGQRSRARYELVKNKSQFRTIVIPGEWEGKPMTEVFTVFSKPILLEGLYYDAFIIKPLATGYLYWAHRPVTGQKRMAFNLFKYAADKSSLEAQNKQDYFKSSHFADHNRVKGNTMLKVEKGQEYILWLSFADKKDFKDRSFFLYVSAIISSDTTKPVSSF